MYNLQCKKRKTEKTHCEAKSYFQQILPNLFSYDSIGIKVILLTSVGHGQRTRRRSRYGALALALLSGCGAVSSMTMASRFMVSGWQLDYRNFAINDTVGPAISKTGCSHGVMPFFWHHKRADVRHVSYTVSPVHGGHLCRWPR